LVPPQARDIFLYYGAVILLGVFLLFRRRTRRGMRLRLRSHGSQKPPELNGGSPAPDNVVDLNPHGFSHIEPAGERPLNVVFNFNGHSWDAYEVLGLPAGSPPEKVEMAYLESLMKMDEGSKPFLDAAYQAIRAQWKMYRVAGN